MLECIRDYIIKDVDENEKCAKCKLDELFEIDVNEEENLIIKKRIYKKFDDKYICYYRYFPNCVLTDKHRIVFLKHTFKWIYSILLKKFPELVPLTIFTKSQLPMQPIKHSN